jgi:hypothetical protein
MKIGIRLATLLEEPSQQAGLELSFVQSFRRGDNSFEPADFSEILDMTTDDVLTGIEWNS